MTIMCSQVQRLFKVVIQYGTATTKGSNDKEFENRELYEVT